MKKLSKIKIIFPLLILWVSIMGCNAQKVKIAIFPDTQSFLQWCPEVLDAQEDWINKNHKQLDAVVQLGDLTQDNTHLEWYTMSNFFKTIEKYKLPYTFTLGNHDMGSKPRVAADVRNTEMVNKYFPVSRVSKQKSWGGSQNEKIDNHYIQFEAGGKKWMIISLAFGPTDESLNWANDIVNQNSDRLIIFNTHAYMFADSTRMGTKKEHKWLAKNYGIGKKEEVNDGEEIWTKFVSKHKNIIAVVSGHVLQSGVGTLVSEGQQGNNVYQMLSNYQGGVEKSVRVKDGYLRLLTFDLKKKEIEVETISAVSGEHHPSAQHNFKFSNVKYDEYTD